MRIKICGIKDKKQALAIASMGINTLGFICVSSSKRYIPASPLGRILLHLPSHLSTIGVFANATVETICEVVMETGLTGVQLHGDESVEFCLKLKEQLPHIELIKAFRGINSLPQIASYESYIDTILLDAYHPKLLGGTGTTLDWEILGKFNPKIPWLLAGGLTPDNVLMAIEKARPGGIDLSSGVEHSPGNKDLEKVTRLLTVAKQLS